MNARIEHVRLKNFKAFQDVTVKGLQPFTVLVGANGTGKSTFFDVFVFLKDCLKDNVRTALAKRGGFKEVVTRGKESEAILIELKSRIGLPVGQRVVTYKIEIEQRGGIPFVRRELLQYIGKNSSGKQLNFVDFSTGLGTAIENELEITEDGSENLVRQRLDSPDILAIKGLGQFQRFEAASALRNLIENWHISDFHINAGRSIPEAGVAEHLSLQGENLPLVAQHLYENHRPVFDRILKVLERRVPGVANVVAETTVDGRVVLRFQDRAFKDPFVSRYVSDGTIKMFAYLVLLYDPQPHPLLCIEEPENQLYPSLMVGLAEEFAAYARRGQVFVSTHSPDFLDAVQPASLLVLSKRGGVTVVQKATDFPHVADFVAAGEPLGALWRQRVFEGADLQ